MAAKTAQEVRIIGGKWKGRKLRFEGDHTLRPTLGRTRETLFNWLRPVVHEMACLDLFAGSGVLGFESLSQGAMHCTFVDSNRRTIHALQRNIANLNASSDTVVKHSDALKFLYRCQTNFDIVFLDPPYANPQLLEETLDALEISNITVKYLYIETRADFDLSAVTARFFGADVKTTRAGETQAILLDRSTTATDPTNNLAAP